MKNIRLTYFEPIIYNKTLNSIANTYAPTNDLDKSIIRSTNYARIGQAKYADPFPIKQRLLNWNWENRKLDLLNSLNYYKNKDLPDVITINPLKIVDYY